MGRLGVGVAAPMTSLDDDEVQLVDPHFAWWLRLAVSIVGTMLLAGGVLGNALVPIVVWRNRDLRSSTNLFLVNLSVADLMVLLVCTPTILVEVHSKPEVWLLGHTMCKVVPFIELTVAHGSALTILAISFDAAIWCMSISVLCKLYELSGVNFESVERYYAICRPLEAIYKLTRMRALVLIVVLWSVAGLATFPVATLTRYETVPYIDGKLVTACITSVHMPLEKAYFLAIMAAFFFVPLMALIALYGAIVHRLVTRPRIMGRRVETATMRARRQVALTVGTVVAAFFLCLLPFRVFNVWYILADQQAVRAIPYQTYFNTLFSLRLLVYLNSAINPALYNLTSTKFRKAFVRALRMRGGSEAYRGDKRHHLDRQTTFNTTFTSLYSSLKSRALERASSNTKCNVVPSSEEEDGQGPGVVQHLDNNTGTGVVRDSPV